MPPALQNDVSAIERVRTTQRRRLRASLIRRAVIAVVGLVTIALSPLVWSTVLTGIEPPVDGGLKGWLVSAATTLHDFGLLVLLVLFVGAGVLLTGAYDRLRSRLFSDA